MHSSSTLELKFVIWAMSAADLYVIQSFASTAPAVLGAILMNHQVMSL